MRSYLGGGLRGPWQGAADDAYRPFERADGSVMTNEEIARVAQVEPMKPKAGTEAGPRPRGPLSDADVERAWTLTAELGQAGAARAIGITQAGVQHRLEAYQKRHGLSGPLPGKLPKESNGAMKQAAIEAISEVVQLAQSLPVDDEAIVRTTPAPEPTVVLVHHGDPDARAAAFNEGYDKAVEDYTPPKAIDALIDWLTENGPHWNDAEAERWLKAFTATIDLVYPTRAAA